MVALLASLGFKPWIFGLTYSYTTMRNYWKPKIPPIILCSYSTYSYQCRVRLHGLTI